MKKVILSTLAAAALVTTASAEIKVGVGIDVMTAITNPVSSGGFAKTLGSTPVVRIAIDGLVDGLRVEPRIAFASSENPNQTDGSNLKKSFSAYGIGAYYDLTKVISVGGFYDMISYTTSKQDPGTDVDTSATSMGIVLKAEANIAENFTIASELGFASTTTTPDQTGAKDMKDLHPISSVTLRYFF